MHMASNPNEPGIDLINFGAATQQKKELTNKLGFQRHIANETAVQKDGQIQKRTLA